MLDRPAEVERLQGLVDQHDGPGYWYEMDKLEARERELEAEVGRLRELHKRNIEDLSRAINRSKTALEEEA